MNKILTVFISLLAVNSISIVAREISITELTSLVDGNTYQSKIDQFTIDEKMRLRASPYSFALPEVSFFGGVKSHQKNIELKENQFLGLRSKYTLFDGGEKKLSYKLSQLDLTSAEKDKKIHLNAEINEFLTYLVKEKAILEKLEFLKSQEQKLSEVILKSKTKVRAGVLSPLALLSIEVKIKELENVKNGLQEELGLVHLEKTQKFISKDEDIRKIILKESLDQAIHYLKQNNLGQGFELAQLEGKIVEVEKTQMQNIFDQNFIKPRVMLFVEKGLTRKIEGEHLESEEGDRLAFGLEFELPLVSEGGKNVQEFYAAKTRQKILELERDGLSANSETNKKINLLRIENNEKGLQRSSLIVELKQKELKLKESSVNSGLVEFPNYVESLVRWIEVRLAELEKKENLALSFLNF